MGKISLEKCLERRTVDLKNEGLCNMILNDIVKIGKNFLVLFFKYKVHSLKLIDNFFKLHYIEK